MSWNCRERAKGCAVVDERTRDEQVSAYVDGALDPQDAARMAEAIARDPALASHVAHYQALRAGVASLASDTVIIAIPERYSGAGRPAWRPAVLAASAILIAAGAVWWLVLTGPISDDIPAQIIIAESSDLATMIAHFDKWASGAQNVTTEGPLIGIAAIVQANGLQQTSLERVTLPLGRKADALGFVGPSNCHLGLYVTAHAGDRPAGLAISDDGHVLIAQWAGPHQQMTMVSRSMNATRFAILALALRNGTDAPNEIHPDLLSSLATARQPCLG
ncbi:hypothetical protein LCGC14_0619700 [marine sediment metagenome]|jgi:hypothetical protein|uniref:Transmembrane transcriptional regulator (Anti-sigma factor RsiW) n=2 Tax=root TaxID=1 RepID=A0ABY0SSX8_9RHOB|nr:hypothetical protein SAMN04488512_12131 [Sulfitobacter litoralis]